MDIIAGASLARRTVNLPAVGRQNPAELRLERASYGAGGSSLLASADLSERLS